ncbi:hypothetical protein SOVF_213110 isoform A, partial [Spinacia oleracea]
ILNMSPRLHAMTDSNPQLQEMMQNSIVLCQLVFPEMMQVLDCRIRPKIFSFKLIVFRGRADNCGGRCGFRTFN